MGLILSKIAVVFSMAGIGLGANKLNILPTESNKYLIALLLNIATPCLLITSIAGKELTEETVSITVITMIGVVLWFLIAMIVAYGVAVALKVPRQDRGVYISIINMVNNGFMGFPITQASFGDDALYLMVLCNIILCIWTYTVGFFQINIGTGEFNRETLRRNLKSMINPCAVASFIGIFLLFTQIKLPEFLFSLLESVGQISIPLSMIVVGVQLGQSNIKKVIVNKKLVVTSIYKQILQPILTFLCVAWLPIPTLCKLVLTFSACFPAAVNMVAVASLENRNATLASEGVALTTILSMITLPVAIVLLTTWMGGL
ncbi:MAG: AEC family transporter [Firmicutes bacterium]|nr:AEC family transporter [Bacillota bacterium]